MKTYKLSELINSKSLLAVFLLFLSACSSKEKPNDLSAKSNSVSKKYEIGVVTQKGLASEVKLPAELKPFEEVAIYPKVNGFVKNLYVDRGSKVKKGDLLLTLEAPEIESQLQTAQSQYLQALEVSRASEDKYKRLKDASKEAGSVSILDLDNALAKMKGDQATANGQRSNVNLVKNMQSYLTIRAPFDGVIIQRNVSAGALSGISKNGQQPLLLIQHLQKLRLEVQIPEAYVEKVDLKKPVSIIFTAIPGLNIQKMISRSANSLGVIRSEAIEIDVQNDDLKLKPGMYGEVKIPLLSAKKSLLVPNHAIVRSTERQFIIKVVQGKAILTDIKEGLAGPDSTEVFGNLQPGDQIILHATDEIKQGTAIK
ncbi:RND family efflux transporter MFP subunit [Pedobacter cryoconitis]|uniref:efflux RND transporter periplasmic adaptor subunit n=1 Tax=Pedobacter cryoconitis TaxID=188932 RepID=UPI001620315A|nr:efflux RND transporter periplasmic adaptor subunit [Pedobacter cryoconitis]MBB6269992.1 RND family efflux transporter MFP subunit [Pedobacter cryoconitis]